MNNNLWIVKSDSTPIKEYTVQLIGSRWLCSCPSFCYNCHDSEGFKSRNTNGRKKRFCKHILKIKGSVKYEAK